MRNLQRLPTCMNSKGNPAASRFPCDICGAPHAPSASVSRRAQGAAPWQASLWFLSRLPRPGARSADAKRYQPAGLSDFAHQISRAARSSHPPYSTVALESANSAPNIAVDIESGLCAIDYRQVRIWCCRDLAS